MVFAPCVIVHSLMRSICDSKSQCRSNIDPGARHCGLTLLLGLSPDWLAGSDLLHLHVHSDLGPFQSAPRPPRFSDPISSKAPRRIWQTLAAGKSLADRQRPLLLAGVGSPWGVRRVTPPHPGPERLFFKCMVAKQWKTENNVHSRNTWEKMITVSAAHLSFFSVVI